MIVNLWTSWVSILAKKNENTPKTAKTKQPKK